MSGIGGRTARVASRAKGGFQAQRSSSSFHPAVAAEGSLTPDRVTQVRPLDFGFGPVDVGRPVRWPGRRTGIKEGQKRKVAPGRQTRPRPVLRVRDHSCPQGIAFDVAEDD